MKKPTIYLQIKGNCGNQFFQYAFARNIQEHLGGELYIDYSAVRADKEFALSGSDNLLQDYRTVPYHYVTEQNQILPFKRFLLKLLDKYVELKGFKAHSFEKYKFYLWCAKHLEKYGIYYFLAPYFPFKYPSKKNVIISGYFECSDYFADIADCIKNELTPKHELLEQNVDLYNTITSRESVCITIKRRDVDNASVSDIYEYDINYFYNAVKYIKEHVDNPVFIIFSDNIEWCKENFHIDGEVCYETPNNPIWEKIRLMSACKHFVIHNSTFSWWVQYLAKNDKKIVIAPMRWIKSEQPVDLYEENWTYMTNDGEVRDHHD